MNSPIQKILFGSPGTGKSYSIEHEYLPHLNIDSESENCIKTVFHPEYSYGDFMGKLMPLTQGKKVEYKFYEGHFLKALSIAYRNILDKRMKSLSEVDWSQVNNVALVIDEINRGNSSAIFGTVFQLLDREESGWSSYSVDLSEIEFYKFIERIGVKISNIDDQLKFQFPGESHYVFFESLKEKFVPIGINTETRKVKLPPNLSVIATMNTSDSSIYFMDNAFKRRWEWEFVSIIDDRENPKLEWTVLRFQFGINQESEERVYHGYKWIDFVDALNSFIVGCADQVRKIEDKQIGYWFIKGKIEEMPNGEEWRFIEDEQIKNKLMFFLWDSVFSNRKDPLVNLLDVNQKDLATFGQFVDLYDQFMEKIIERIPEASPEFAI